MFCGNKTCVVDGLQNKQNGSDLGEKNEEISAHHTQYLLLLEGKISKH